MEKRDLWPPAPRSTRVSTPLERSLEFPTTSCGYYKTQRRRRSIFEERRYSRQDNKFRNHASFTRRLCVRSIYLSACFARETRRNLCVLCGYFFLLVATLPL